MSVNSLPSFAQAFNTHALSLSPSTNNALPPIQFAGRKRSNRDDESPRVKKEDDVQPDEQSLAPSSLMPSAAKKRRVTVSGGAPHPLHIDVRGPPPDQSASTPISPVVMGFTLQRDNPNAIEQVRSVISVKQKQQALIEQRRGSAAGIMSPITAKSQPPPPPPATPAAEPPKPPSNSAGPAGPPTRTSRRSPNSVNNNNRRGQRPSSPPPPPVTAPPPSASAQAPPTPISQHSLPPPPISFAKRRAAVLGGKKKPADLLISPREPHTREHLQPSIQSAPPGQAAFRFQMALPRLPSIIGQTDLNVRRVATNVPPTPTRLSMQHNNVPSITAPVPNRSPPAPSVPIASTLLPGTVAVPVPPTPTSLHRPGYAGDKAAFLAPFDMFYDALNDSKQLKSWLSEQLAKSHALMASLNQQQERMNETVEAVVERRVAGVRAEMGALRRRVEELEEVVRQGARRNSIDSHPKHSMNGGPAPPESYAFPPHHHHSHHEPPSLPPLASSSRLRVDRPELSRRLSSPGWGHNTRDSYREGSENEGGSPVPPPPGSGSSGTGFDARRLSISATRHEPPVGSQGSSRSVMQSPSQTFREREKGPGLSRQNSSSTPTVPKGGEREREREWEGETPRRPGSRRNSVSMETDEGDS